MGSGYREVHVRSHLIDHPAIVIDHVEVDGKTSVPRIKVLDVILPFLCFRPASVLFHTYILYRWDFEVENTYFMREQS